VSCADTEWMTLGEANWILWGLALQVGLCPLHRLPLTVTAVESTGNVCQYCDRCYREWYLNPHTGLCAGWRLTSAGWYYTREGKLVFR